jgi:hypothetical protein
MRLFYVTRSWWRFSKRTVFWATILAGTILFRRPTSRGPSPSSRRTSRRGFWRLVLSGLFLGTTVPVVVGWRSPLLLVPFCEALVVLLVLAGGVALLEQAGALLRRRSASAAGAAVLSMVLLASGGAVPPASAAEPPPADRGPAEPSMRIPDDGVILPYDPSGLPGGFGAPEKVYLPYPKFLELWKLAHPEEAPPGAPPADLVLGNAQYVLRVEGESVRIAGTVEIQILTERWTKIPLPFDRAQLTSVRIDGQEAGVGQDPGVGPEQGPAGGAVRAMPFVELKGSGRRRLEVELLVAVRRDPGEFRVLTGLLAGSAATLRAELPRGARIDARRGSGGGDAAPIPLVSSQDAEKTVAVVDLGGADRIEILWSFPKIEGQSGSQVDSVSYSRLDLGREGYEVVRLERVRVTGRKVDALEYAIEGSWRIVDIAGVDVTEWSVLREAGAPSGEKLQVFFAKPVDSAFLAIRGRALMEASGPLATLTLAGAVKQETYVGLRHSADRRFAADVLAGMERASRQDLLKNFQVPESELPDRIYQSYGSGAGLTLATEPVVSEAQVDTDLILVQEQDRLVVSARSRHSVTGLGPLRHEVPIPVEWSVRSVRAAGLRDWEVLRGAEGARLVVSFADRIQSGTEILWSAERLLAAPPDRLELPSLDAAGPGAGTVRESKRWLFAASEELDLTVLEPGRLVPLPLDAVPRWVEIPTMTSYRFGLRTPRAAAEGAAVTALGVARRPSRLGAVVVSFVRVAEDSVQANVRTIFRVRGAGRDRFRFALPAGAELVSIETLNEQSQSVRETEGGTEIEIVLQSPALGEHSVDVSYRVPRESGRPPAVLPIRVFDGAERLRDVDQYVGVLQTSATTLKAEPTPELVRAEPETLPYLPEGIAAASLRPTFRATQADWRLVLVEAKIEVDAGPAAIVELAELTTVIGLDGIARTRVVYTLRNRALQFLIAELPEGAELWGVTLNGSPLAVGEAAGEPSAGTKGRILRIPVERVGAAGLSLEVVLQYEERRLDLPALHGSETLRAPKVRETEVIETIWNVHFPEGYWVRMSGGNLREVASSAQYASKLGNLLDQYQRIVQSGEVSESRRVREQRARDLARLERVLGDNLTQLEITNRSATEQAQTDRLGEETLQEQWSRNDALVARSQEALREARKKREEDAKALAPVSKGEQAFIDTGNFLKQGWRGGKEAQRVVEPTEAAPPGALRLEALLEDSPFEGLKGLPLSPVPSEVETGTPAPVDGNAGLKPLPDSLIGSTAPGLETMPDAKGTRLYTFLRAKGDAELSLSFTRRDAGGRLAALFLLVAVPVAALWLRRRSGRSTRAPVA